MQTDTILRGDIRQIARTLPDGSVHCIVTSPPYYGLRDYGTAEWEGGREDCDHVERNARNDTGAERLAERAMIYGTGQGSGSKVETIKYRDICPKCGAIRKDAQIGLEASPQEYVDTLVGIFRELRRVLRDDGVVFLNLGDSYNTSPPGNKGFHYGPGRTANGTLETGHRGLIANLKPKDLIGIPWRVALALQADGWYLRADIIWSKPNPMPESVSDRPTKAHEYIFLLSKSPRYYYDQEAIREPAICKDDRRAGQGHIDYDGKRNGTNGQGQRAFVSIDPAGRNRRSVWTVATQPYAAAHFATFPPDLIRPCILAGCPERVCSDCGAPWVRVVEKTGEKIQHHGVNGVADKARGRHGKNSVFNTGFTESKETIGFEPTCTCNAPTVPGIVFDPFLGSGTVAQVAIEEGRNWLGCELSQDYIDLAWKRIDAAKLAKVAGRDYAKVMTKEENGYQQLGLIGA